MCIVFYYHVAVELSLYIFWCQGFMKTVYFSACPTIHIRFFIEIVIGFGFLC